MTEVTPALPHEGALSRGLRRVLPVLSVLLAIILIWYVAAVAMNARWERDQAARAGVEIVLPDLIGKTLTQDRPVLPAPHQVAAGLWDGLAGQRSPLAAALSGMAG